MDGWSVWDVWNNFYEGMRVIWVVEGGENGQNTDWTRPIRPDGFVASDRLRWIWKYFWETLIGLLDENEWMMARVHYLFMNERC